MKPPNDIPASELFLKLMESPKPSEVVDFPRRKVGPDGKPTSEFVGKLRIQVLAQGKHKEAQLAAQGYFKGRGYSIEELDGVILREAAGDEIAKELLAMACVTVEPISENPLTYGRIFRTARDLDNLTADEVANLFAQYLMVQKKWGPSETDPDVDHWVKRLEEGGSEFPLLLMSSQDLASLTYALAGRISSIFRLLESQFSTLPDTLKSDLETFNLGTGFWSSPHDDSDDTGSGNWVEKIEVDDAEDLRTRLKSSQQALEDTQRKK